MATSSIRALIVEDSEEDAELILKLFKKEGHVVHHEIVSSSQKMQEALSKEQWDVIISDYSMPGFTGIKALEILKATGLDIPFILVSGKIDEETAVEAMKKGAVDYISKNNLSRLVPAVEREIKDCEIRKKQMKMHSEFIESEERFRLAFNNANIGMCLVDLKGNFTKVNQKLCEILGYRKEELEGLNTSTITYEEDRSAGPKFIKNAVEGKSSNIVFEKRYIHKNGDIVWAEVSSSLVKDEKNSPLYFISQVKDITKNKNAEEALRKSEENYRLIVDNTSDLVFRIDMNGKFIFMSKSVEKHTGYTDHEIVGKNIKDFLSPRSYADAIERIKQRVDGVKNLPKYEVDVISKDGEGIPFELNTSPIYADGKIESILIVARNISERKESEKKYKFLFENNMAGVYRSSFDGTLLECNTAFANILGYNDPSEIQNIPTWKLYPERKDREEFLRKLSDAGHLLNSEICLSRKDGSPVWCIGNVNLIKNEVGEKIIQGTIIDITDRKKAEEALKESEEKYRTIVEGQTEFITRFLPDGTHTFANDALCNYFGVNKGNIIGKKISDVKLGAVIPEEDMKRMKKHFASFSLKDPIKQIQHRFVFPNGNVRWVEWQDKAIFDDSGKITEFQSVGRDISKRRKAEESLKESEERFRLFFEKANDPILLIDEVDSIIEVNEAASKVFGYTKEEFSSKRVSDLQAPEVRGIPGTVIKSEQKKYGEHPFEALDIDKFGRVFPVEVAISKIKFKGKDLTFNISRDISHRKKMEAEIQLLYRAIEQSSSMVVITDKDGGIEYVTPKFTEVTGYASSEVIGKNPRILKTEFLPKEHFEELWKSITSGKNWNGEFHNRKKDGTMYWESASVAPVKDSTGNINHFVKVSEDITYKKLAEKDLQEKEETLRGILSATPIGINLVKDRSIVWCNYFMTEITGYSQQELVGRNTKSLYVNEEEYQRFGDLYREKFEGPVRFETQWITKDRRVIDVLILLNPLNPYDLSKGYITIVSDITKTKKSQKQLGENLEYFAHLVDHIRNPLAIMSGFIQVEVENEKTKERILRQIDRIEELIKQLDQGWMDTEETRRFLKRYL